MPEDYRKEQADRVIAKLEGAIKGASELAVSELRAAMYSNIASVLSLEYQIADSQDRLRVARNIADRATDFVLWLHQVKSPALAAILGKLERRDEWNELCSAVAATKLSREPKEDL